MSAAHKICPACRTRATLEALYCRSCGADIRGVGPASDPYLDLVIADKFRVEELIGEGAMGRVYKARQVTLKKPFAIKILASHLMNDETSAARFAAEAHNCASLNHPNVVSVVDYGRTVDGITYIVMEFIEGQSLETIIGQQFPLPRPRIVDLTLQVLSALTEAHGLGILHRDLKPENILVQSLRTHGELAKVLDFGIAKLMDRPDIAAKPGLTSQGMVCGTPEYMSPEQARGRELDQRSDLYSVGVILYQMMTGRPPFESTSAVEILHKHLHEDPTPPSRVLGTEPDALEAVCLRALAKDPGGRYASALEFREDLIAATSARPGLGAGESACGSCGAPIRPEHRFCPSCGSPAPREPASRPVRRRATRGSGFHPPLTRGYPTAELVVRNFPLPLVGREHLFERARNLLTRPQPTLRVRVLSGPRGVGKTRLSDEIAALAERSGWRAYYAGADPSGARIPLWPIRSLVAQILDVDVNTVTTQDLGRAANLCGVAFEELPGLAELFALQGPAHRLESAVRRRECFASAVQALLSGGRGQPLLLVFDDVDMYDSASREVLRRLSRARASAPVVALAATCEEDVEWLAGVVERVEPLDAEAMRRLGQRVSTELSASTRIFDRLVQAAPATPLRLESLLRLMAAGVPAPIEAHEIDLLRLRLDNLAPAARTVIEVASILGERMSEADLAEQARLDDATLSQVRIDEALARLHVEGMLVIVGEGERAFHHRMLHEVVYGGIDDRRRERLHSLAATGSTAARRSVVARTVHLVRAAAPNAVEALVEAAKAAEAGFDEPAAGDFLAAALRFSKLDTAEQASGGSRADLAIRASKVMRGAETAWQAVELIDSELRSQHAPIDEAALLHEKGVQIARLARFDEAVAVLKKALGPAIAAGDRPMMLEVYEELGRVHAKRSALDTALEELREGLDMCTLGEGPRAQVDIDLWRYLLRIAEVHRTADDLSAARTWCEHALFQAERRADRLGLLRCHGQMSWILRDLKQLALAEQHLARALEEARHFGDRLTTAELLIERARARAARGRLADAQRCCEEALRLAKGIQWAAGVEHAERAIAMLSRKSPLQRSSAPAEQSGSFERPPELRR